MQSIGFRRDELRSVVQSCLASSVKCLSCVDPDHQELE
jgi:hypothetical protein